MKLKREFDVALPSLPNFIYVGGVAQPVADFSQTELHDIGMAWTAALLKHALAKGGNRRAAKKEAP